MLCIKTSVNTGFCAEKNVCVCVKVGLGKGSACKNFFVQSVWTSFLCQIFPVLKSRCAKIVLCKGFSV